MKSLWGSERSLVKVVFHTRVLPEGGYRIVEAGLNGAFGDSDRGGDFGKGHVVYKAHEQDFAVGFGEGGEDGRQFLAGLVGGVWVGPAGEIGG